MHIVETTLGYWTSLGSSVCCLRHIGRPMVCPRSINSHWPFTGWCWLLRIHVQVRSRMGMYWGSWTPIHSDIRYPIFSWPTAPQFWRDWIHFLQFLASSLRQFPASCSLQSLCSITPPSPLLTRAHTWFHPCLVEEYSAAWWKAQEARILHGWYV